MPPGGPPLLEFLRRRRAGGACVHPARPSRGRRAGAANARGGGAADRSRAGRRAEGAAGAAAAQRGARREPGCAGGAATRPWWRRGSRSACSWGRSTRFTKRPRRWRWRARWRKSRASASCRCSGCRRRITTTPRLPAVPSPAPTGRRRGSALPDEAPADGAGVGRPPAARPRGRRLLAELADALPPGPAADETLAPAARALPGGAAAGGGVRRADGALVRRRRAAGPGPARRRGRAAGPARSFAARSPRRRRSAPSWPQRAAALEAAGFDVQIPVRADCSLVFFHRDRRRPVRGTGCRAVPAGWQLVGSDHLASEGELADALATDPLRFSTSALLRPILQDTLLPTAAYVGGPAEVSYFAQLGPLYARFGLAPPLVVPRARFLCVDARSRRLLGQLGLSSARRAGAATTRPSRRRSRRRDRPVRPIRSCWPPACSSSRRTPAISASRLPGRSRPTGTWSGRRPERAAR